METGKITTNHVHVLVKSTHNQTDNLPVLLPLVAYIDIRLTQNIFVDLCLTNGTPGEIRVCHLKRRATFKKSKIYDVEFLNV